MRKPREIILPPKIDMQDIYQKMLKLINWYSIKFEEKSTKPTLAPPKRQRS